MAQDPDEGGPVESVWKLLRTGHPLLVIYNALEPEERLVVDDMPGATEEKVSKIAIMKFYQACLKDLKLPPAESFMIKDLTGSDTTGFVKVGGIPNYAPVLLLSGDIRSLTVLGHLCYQLRFRPCRPTWTPQ